MTQNKCGDCRYLGDAVVLKNDPAPTGFYSCDRIKHLNNDYLERHEAEDIGKDLAHVLNGSGYHASIRVREEFGCEMFERRKDA